MITAKERMSIGLGYYKYALCGPCFHALTTLVTDRDTTLAEDHCVALTDDGVYAAAFLLSVAKRRRARGLEQDFDVDSKGQVSIPEAIDHLMDPVACNNAQGRRPHGFICLHVDDLFMGGDKVFEDEVLASLRRDFAVGSEDKNDVMFVGQRIKWKTHEKYGPYISVDQKLAVDAAQEVEIDKTLKDNIQCNPQLHTAYGQF
eukprot:s573_g13.t1